VQLRSTLPAVAVALLGGSIMISAQVIPPSSPPGPSPQIASTVAGRATPGAQSMIHGTAVDINGKPLVNAFVRLRNLQTNRVEQVSTANQRGEFSFVAQPGIPYVVEIADDAGQIIAVGDVVVVQAGEVAGAVVALPMRRPPAGVFGETAGSVVSAAAGTGLTALQSIVTEPQPPPASPER
jgi:hypothetical protein